ncbi:hypothetical protein GCM10008967_01490 [Bacillus carboniphilus]|uniref:NAD(P)-binding domain-containing protein n=1 Tax=Bacillus carboniphilus TaxID=86663 RepID=A0ABN0VR53_9BACI
MDKIYIYGVYDFVSFEFCQQLLHEGYEVAGVRYPFAFQDTEKSLLVGRNANFTELQSVDGLSNQEQQGSSIFIISHYDHQYINEAEYMKIKKHLEETVNKLKIDRTLVMVPRELTSTEVREEPYMNLVKECQKILPKPQYVGLPPLYGLGQPENDILYRVANQRKNEETKIPNSSLEDALPLSETVSFLINQLENHNQDIVLNSDVELHYKKCIESLVGEKWDWAGSLPSFNGFDFSTYQNLEVVCGESTDELLKVWSGSIKGPQSKNTFQF